MAETRDITITIKGENGGGENNSADLNVSKFTSTDNTTTKNSNSGMAKAAYSQMALQATNTVANAIIGFADYQLDNYMNLHDDYIGQRKMNIDRYYINGAASVASTTANMAMVGAAAGPAGAIVGALVGLFVSGMNIAQSNIKGNNEQNIQLKQLDLQLQYTRRRAGWSTHAASIGEDL